MNSARASLPSAAVRVRLQVVGAAEECLAEQTLQNLWVGGRHAASQLLGCLEVAEVRLIPSALERLTWALWSWPEVTEILLCDRQAGEIVGRLVRHATAAPGNAAMTHVWRADWVEGEAKPLSRSADAVPTVDFPPSTSSSEGWLNQWLRVSRLDGLVDTSAAAVAGRERIKVLIQRVAGPGIARLAHRGFQMTIAPVRRLQARSPCPADTLLPATAGMFPEYQDERVGLLVMAPRLDPGGAEKNIIDLVLRLARSGFRVHLMTTVKAENRWSARLSRTGIEILHLPEFLPVNCWASYVTQFIVGRRIDVLHVMNSHWAFEQLARFKAACPDLQVVSQLHAEGEPGIPDMPALAAQHDRYVDRHTVISDHLRGHMQRNLGVAAHKIQVVRSGIEWQRDFDDDAQRSAWRRAHGVAHETPVVIFVGRFSEFKRPLLFLSIAEEVLTQYPDALFVMQGQGPLEAAVRRQLAARPRLAARLRLVGATESVDALMAAADLMVLPSVMEGIAYVSYEAMSHGLPQVFADVGGQSELLTPGTGIAVRNGPGELTRYVNAVSHLLRDKAARARIGQAARSRLQNWPDADDSAADYRRLYLDLLNESDTRPSLVAR